MKKVIGILALLAMTGNIASAELLKNFKYDGKIEVNTYQVKNADYSDDATDKRNNTDPRVQINAGFDLNEDVSAVVSIVKENRQYGDVSEDANDIQNSMQFEQAYLNLKGVLGLDHKLGRQYYGNEGDLIVYYGPTSWPFTNNANVNTPNVSALEGWSSVYNYGKWNFGAVLAKDTNTNPGEDRDEDLFGVTAKYALNDDLNLGGYVYQYNTQVGNRVGPNDRLQVLGVKADGKFMGFTYHGEVAKNMGTNNQAIYNLGGASVNDYTGMGYLANVKYEMDLMGKITFMGEYASGSGDDDVTATDDESATFYGISSDYRPGVIWGGDFLTSANAGGAGISNLTTYNVGAMWNPSKVEKLTLAAKYFHFAPTEEPTTYDVYGNELNLCANWKHSENVGVKAYYAMFMPDSDYAVAVNGAGAKDDATTVLGAAFTVKF